jgi:hypothetical protein
METLKAFFAIFHCKTCSKNVLLTTVKRDSPMVLRRLIVHKTSVADRIVQDFRQDTKPIVPIKRTEMGTGTEIPHTTNQATTISQI